jgi:chaperonin cofactor prefoldin
MTDKKLTEKIVMFRNELHLHNPNMGILTLFDSMCVYFGEQYRTIETQKEEIERNQLRIKSYEQGLQDRDESIESLKGTAKLAIEKFEDLASHVGDILSKDFYYDAYLEVKQKSADYAKEIKNLTREKQMVENVIFSPD